ncbi:hypothetical protein [Plebeiibacterium marinum]|uniref:Uncharacterized protein n=1 Tax=Plebeiibacterium marinum TaxID=2992111 RepID=A0AAE3ME45_9BACT|nr:hypothetical protein [Plebeiobacterium marinum]MCW3806128.1 hypothetical protein [Plebeiobacterium marinum]
MSRSFQKSKIFGITIAKSEKEDKRIANKKLRRLVRQKIKGKDFDLVTIRDVSNRWSFDKEGKQYWALASKKDMRK